MGQFSRAGGGGGGAGGGHEDPLKAISHHRHWQRVMRKISGRDAMIPALDPIKESGS